MKKIIITTLVVLLAITGLAKWEKNRSNKQQTTNDKQQITTQLAEQKKIKVAAKLVKSKTETDKAELQIIFKPDGDPISLGAFSLKLSLKPQTGGKLSLGKLKLSEGAIAAGWSFPIAAYQVEPNDNLTIKLSGGLVSKEQRLISSDTIIAAVPITGQKISFSSVSMDDSVTQFFDPKHEVINVNIEPKVIVE